jgi:hypothetical protein
VWWNVVLEGGCGPKGGWQRPQEVLSGDRYANGIMMVMAGVTWVGGAAMDPCSMLQQGGRHATNKTITHMD